MSAPSIEHLSADMRKFVRRIDRDFELEDHHRRLLVLAAEAHDRAQQARERLAKDGLTITTRHGEVRSHPCCAIERDSAIRFTRILRELGLAEHTGEATRPPRLSGRYVGRVAMPVRPRIARRLTTDIPPHIVRPCSRGTSPRPPTSPACRRST